VKPLEQRLRVGLGSLGLALSDAQIDQCQHYLALLERWNKVYNLTAVRDSGEMLTQHLLDCLAVLPPLRQQCGDGPLRVLDVGAGAGLPGVVLAIARPDSTVVCVDAVLKKTSFVQQVALSLGLANLLSVHARVEDLQTEAFDVITCRAFASLADWVRLTQQHLKPGGVWMAMKGRALADELAALPPSVQMFHVEPLRVPGLDAERCLVWLRPVAAVAS